MWIDFVQSVQGTISPSGLFIILGSAGWYCITKGSILLRAALFFCVQDITHASKFPIFPLNVVSEEFVHRILSASPLVNLL